MVQGPQTVYPSLVRGKADRPTQSGPTAFAGPSPGLDGPSPDTVDAGPNGGVHASNVIRHQGVRIALTRAESIRQIAHKSLIAIQTTYAEMATLAERVDVPGTAAEGRGSVDTAFQDLKTELLSVIGSAILNGDKILELPDTSSGALNINLNVPAIADLLPGFAASVDAAPIPLGDLAASHILTEASARSVLDGAKIVVHRLAAEIDHLESYQAEFQRLLITDDRSGQPYDDGVKATPDSPMPLPALARSVSNQIVIATEIPFAGQADRLREIVRLADGQNAASASSNSARPPLMPAPEPDPADSVVGVLHSGPEITGSITLRGAPANSHAATDTDNRADGGQTPETHAPAGGGERPQPNSSAVTMAQRSPLPDRSSPFSVAADNSADLLPPPDAKERLHLSVWRPSLSDGKGTPATVGEPAIGSAMGSFTSAGGKGRPEPAAASIDPPAKPTDPTGAPFVLAMLDLDPARHRSAGDIRLSEVPKLVELDAGRRSAGLVHQVRDADLRADVGLSIVRTTYEASTDRVDQNGTQAPADPGGFMAELIRADTVLRAADAAIEQIELHLDYLRGLADEAATGTSRDRGTLDDIFQAVKVNVIDALARNTEAAGERILAGGDHPGAAYVIELSEGGASGGLHQIAIPSMRLMNLAPDLGAASIETAPASAAALRAIDFAGAEIARTRDMIAGERTLIQRLMSIERAQAASWLPLAHSALGS